MKDCRDLKRLKQLTKDDVLLITENELTRGVDYRAAKDVKGISLLVMSESCNMRAYIQLLGRVGRFNEPCKRFLWFGLEEPVNMT